MIAKKPFLSVVMPAYRGTTVLPESLPALLASDLPRSDWELIVVDDASGDDTPLIAEEYADVVVRLDGSAGGPAHARNRGVEAAKGQVVLFVDADVCVHPAALPLVIEAFRADRELAALFGSYDAKPRAPGVVSQFRNLLHHHVHQMNPGPAETFWAGCGAVRRDVFFEIGMMDAWRYPRPQIEDIEMGRRLRGAGYRIELRPDIQCTHLKRWTLGSMTRTDFLDRGVPWMRLLLAEGPSVSPATLNLRPKEKAATALVAAAALSLLAALLLRSVPAVVFALGATAGVVTLNLRFYRLLRQTHGIVFTAAAIPLHMLFYFTAGSAGVVGAVLHHVDRLRGAPNAPEHTAGPVSEARQDVDTVTPRTEVVPG